MWNVITHLLAFAGGTLAGVVLMCFMTVAGREDERMEK